MTSAKSRAFPFLVLGAWLMAWLPLKEAAAAEQAPSEQRRYWTDAASEKIPESPEILRLGKRNYEERCIVCHGRRGLGDGPAADLMLTKPRDFSSAQFKLRTTMDFPTDEDLFRTITTGFPAYGMPEFDYLSGEARWGLVYTVKQLGREGYQARRERESIQDKLGLDAEALTVEQEAQFKDQLERIRQTSAEIAQEYFQTERLAVQPQPAPFSAEAVKRGKEFYLEMECHQCHGESGHGDGPSAAELTDEKGRKIWPRDFALNPWYFKAGDRAEDIVRVLITGMPGTPMPSYDLGPDYHADLWKLAHYVRTLSAPAIAPGGARGIEAGRRGFASGLKE